MKKLSINIFVVYRKTPNTLKSVNFNFTYRGMNTLFHSLLPKFYFSIKYEPQSDPSVTMAYEFFRTVLIKYMKQTNFFSICLLYLLFKLAINDIFNTLVS